MKKTLVVVALVVGVLCATAILIFFLRAAAFTEPYMIKPMTASPAPNGVKVGHTMNANTRTLSVFSSNAVVVVADPGVSFQYEVLWIVEQQRNDKSDDLLEYRFELPEYAVAEHINPIGSEIPPTILKAANGNQWR